MTSARLTARLWPIDPRVVIRMIFDDSRYYTGPDLTESMVRSAEARLGFTLPRAYLDLLRVRNGGRPVSRCVRTRFPTTWTADHFAIEAIRGIGGRWGIDSDEVISSTAMIEEWGYPRIGIVICEMPSAGHDAVMLDYSVPGREPSVAYVDEDRVARVVAPSFAGFVAGLVSCHALGDGDFEAPEGFAWHHARPSGMMQLVERTIHLATGHAAR